MTLKPFKFVVHTVVIEEDEDGRIVGERATEQPTVLYGIEGLREFVGSFEDQLAKLNEPATRNEG